MRLAARLHQQLSATEGSAVPFTSDMDNLIGGAPMPAAVLIAITERPEPGVILTQRPNTMRTHAGQVAFPGGRIDPGDRDATAAALREAGEEIALDPTLAEVVGSLPPYATVTGFSVTPVIAVIPPDLPLVAHASEVAAVFEVPLAFVLNTQNRSEHSIDYRGRQRSYFEYIWSAGQEPRRIWGATAAILANLAARLC